MKRFLLAFLFLTSFAWSQGSSFQGQAIGKGSGNFLVAIPNASVTVCSDQACTSPINLYTDTTLGTQSGNPVTADLSGNYSFYAAPGSYFCKITASAFSSVTLPCAVPTAPGVDLVSNQTIGGNKAYTGALSACISNGVMQVGAGAPYSTCWGNGDIGSQINAAYAAGASTGVHIHVAPGIYNFTTPITFTTISKPVFLECASGPQTNAALVGSTTQLNFTPSTGTAMTLDSGMGSKISGCSLTGASAANSTIGLLLGGPNTVSYAVFDHIDIGDFGAGVQLADNVYINAFDNVTIHDNGINFNVPTGLFNTGESMHFHGGSISMKSSGISAGCITLGTGGDWFFSQMSIDQCGVSINGNGGTWVNFSSVHWENPNGSSATPYITFGTAANNATVTITGGYMLEDTSSARTEFIKDTSTVSSKAIGVTILGGTYTPAQATAQLVNNSGSSCCGRISINGIQNGQGGGSFSNLVGGTWFATNISDAVNGYTTNEWFTFNERSAPSGLAGSDLLWADVTSHRVKMNNNNAGQDVVVGANTTDTFTNKSVAAGPVTGTVASGTAAMTTAAIAAGACGTTVTVSATGVATTDAIIKAYNAAPSANPAQLVISAWPTANNVNFQYCNPTAGSITPTAATLNWRVVR